MISAPPQGFLASALMDSAVDGVTLAVSGGRAAVNLANPNTWTAEQTFNAGITGTGSTGTLTAGSGITGGTNLWTGGQTFEPSTLFFAANVLANKTQVGGQTTQTVAGVEGSLLSIAQADVAWVFAMDGAGNVGVGGSLRTTDNLMAGAAGWTYAAGGTPGQAAPEGQGAYIGWNLSVGTGETDYLNAPGGGTGGHYWYNWNGSAWNNLAYIDSAGNFTVMSAAGASGQGVIRAPNWNGSNWGLQIGANASGVAAIMANAPSGFVDWLELLMVAGSPKWHVDASGNAVAAGTVSGASLTSNTTINSNQLANSFAGTTAGTVYWNMPYQGSGYKKVMVFLDAYENDTTTAQTITYPTAFTYIPNVYNQINVPGVFTSTTALSIDPDTTTAYTGWIIVEGF